MLSPSVLIASIMTPMTASALTESVAHEALSDVQGPHYCFLLLVAARFNPRTEAVINAPALCYAVFSLVTFGPALGEIAIHRALPLAPLR